MVGPRDRSRHRGIEIQDQYELQELQTTHCRLTHEGSTAHIEDSYSDRDHGHPQNPEAQRLDRRLLRMCKERLMGVLGTCKARSAGVMRRGKGALAMHRMTALSTASLCVLLFLAYYGLNPKAAPSENWFDRSTGRSVGHYQSTTTVTGSSTVYRIITVQYEQFYGARRVHHQAPIAVSSNLESKGQVKPQDLSHLQVRTRTSTLASGLYFMPMSVTNGDWPPSQQDTHSSHRPPSNTQGSPTLQVRPVLENSELEAKTLLQSHEVRAPRSLFAGQANADTNSFIRWGVETLNGLRLRSRRSLHFSKGWCIENACSPHKQLIFMCNTTKTISDSFRKQECEWCYPENQRKHREIDKHCTEVSKRALNALFVICGIFLFCTLVIVIPLATQTLRRRRKAKAGRILPRNAMTTS